MKIKEVVITIVEKCITLENYNYEFNINVGIKDILSLNILQINAFKAKLISKNKD